jgi:hypothetical protein
MRSGMRSWSKWVIFSRRMKSSSSVGPAALPQGVLVVGHRDALVGGHGRMLPPAAGAVHRHRPAVVLGRVIARLPVGLLAAMDVGSGSSKEPRHWNQPR